MRIGKLSFLAALGAAGLASAWPAVAQSGLVRLMIPLTPGITPDPIARVISPLLQGRQPDELGRAGGEVPPSYRRRADGTGRQ